MENPSLQAKFFVCDLAKQQQGCVAALVVVEPLAQ
jgi:hypothetical protein